MHQSVRDAFVEFTEKFEGKVPFMYLDVRNLVTTAIGNLIDPMSSAIGLPWRRPDGTLADYSEVAAEWMYVKSRTDLSQRGGMAYGAVTHLRLDDEGIAGVVQGKLLQNETYLKKRFPQWESWPADAQLGVLSMAWALGPAFNYPKFVAAAQEQDWETCAKECHMEDSKNPGLRPRNKANVTLFLNARTIACVSADVTELGYPEVLPEPSELG